MDFGRSRLRKFPTRFPETVVARAMASRSDQRGKRGAIARRWIGLQLAEGVSLNYFRLVRSTRLMLASRSRAQVAHYVDC